jgi:hypothetical protein
MTLYLAKVVDFDDTRVVQAGGSARFLQESLAEIRAPGKLWMHNLDSDVSLQGDISRFQDRAHPTFAQEADDLVSIEALTD